MFLFFPTLKSSKVLQTSQAFLSISFTTVAILLLELWTCFFFHLDLKDDFIRIVTQVLFYLAFNLNVSPVKAPVLKAKLRYLESGKILEIWIKFDFIIFHEGLPNVLLTLSLSVWSLHILSLHMWVFYSAFRPWTKMLQYSSVLFH